MLHENLVLMIQICHSCVWKLRKLEYIYHYEVDLVQVSEASVYHLPGQSIPKSRRGIYPSSRLQPPNLPLKSFKQIY